MFSVYYDSCKSRKYPFKDSLSLKRCPVCVSRLCNHRNEKTETRLPQRKGPPNCSHQNLLKSRFPAKTTTLNEINQFISKIGVQVYIFETMLTKLWLIGWESFPPGTVTAHLTQLGLIDWLISTQFLITIVINKREILSTAIVLI